MNKFLKFLLCVVILLVLGFIVYRIGFLVGTKIVESSDEKTKNEVSNSVTAEIVNVVDDGNGIGGGDSEDAPNESNEGE